MIDLLKKLTIVLVCSVILMILVAAGAEESGIHLSESISATVQSITGGYSVIIALFSAWLLIVGVMCKKLSSIPGVHERRAHSTIQKS